MTFSNSFRVGGFRFSIKALCFLIGGVAAALPLTGVHFEMSAGWVTVILYYTDNGNGMDQNTLSRMFDPFFTTRRSQDGTGLGMHILYNLVTQSLGGYLECTSTPGEGVVFLIRIPVRPSTRST